MGEDRVRTKPYGAWPSPISAELVATDGRTFGHVALDGETVYWREERPSEDGRGVIVRDDDGTIEDVTPEGIDVRTLVHEYGGGDFAVHDGTVFFAAFDDQRVYRLDGMDEPTAITPEPEIERGLRHADFEVSADGQFLYCVREDHDVTANGEMADREKTDRVTARGEIADGETADGERADRKDAEDERGEPTNEVVRIATEGEESPEVIASGHDFYAAPRLSPDGNRLTWLAWDHPRMPWDGTELYVTTLANDGSRTGAEVVLGGPDESVFQPIWSPDGSLYAVSDRTGWWNVYRVPLDGREPEPICDRPAEYGYPLWQLGLSTIAFLDDGTIAAIVTEDGEQHLELLRGDERTVAQLPFETFSPRLHSDGASLIVLAGGPRTPTSVVRWTPGNGPEIVRRSTTVDVDDAYLSTPEHVTYETRDGEIAHAWVYLPTNPDVDHPTFVPSTNSDPEHANEERPPLVVFAHGGPTGASSPTHDLALQYFTSRGFAVADVNYRGSTGYGRAYREALYGEWGVFDVTDTIDAARHLVDSGVVDPNRVAVRGGSAGGYVVLSALAFHDEFDAGTSYYGVADLTRLAEMTHKFESRYLDQLVGPYPDAADTYRERSPVHHADGVDAPVLLLQGADDPVVPLSQAEAMVDALAETDVPRSLLVFEDEQHGFRRADSRRRAVEAELTFYGEVFDFEPADDFPDLELSTADDA